MILQSFMNHSIIQSAENTTASDYPWLFRLHPSFTSVPTNTDSNVVTLLATMKGRSLKCLVDTGASLNFISSKLMSTESIKPWGLYIHPSDTVCQVANNQKLRSLGRVQLPIEINKQVYSIPAEIVPDLAFDLILGTPFLTDHQCILDFNSKQLIVGQPPNNDTSILLRNDITIPSYCHTFVDVTCHGLQSKNRVLT